MATRTLGEIIEANFTEKNIPYIELRKDITLPEGNDIDIFYGACEMKDNELISLDKDTYSKNLLCSRYYTYLENDEEKNRREKHLVVWVA